jgi:hypothetical protein
LLDEQNIVAHLMIYVWNKQVNWPTPGSVADNRYFEYVIKRYQAYPNVIWDISKEALAYGKDDMDYITERIERLRRLDQHKRLVTVHDYKYCSKYPEKVDIISIQDWSTDLYNNMLRISEKYAKPVFNIEHGGYEYCQYDVFTGNYTNPEVCLRRNYLCAFAGIYSSYYWQCTSWNVIIHNPFDESIEPKPKFAYYRHFSDFLKQADFAHLTPVQGLSASGFSLFHKKKDQYFYFVPGENSAIDIKNLPEADFLEISWFHPYNGEYSRTETVEWSNYFRLKPAFPGMDSILIITLK